MERCAVTGSGVAGGMAAVGNDVTAAGGGSFTRKTKGKSFV